jgi:hypothetical protein
MRRRRQQRVLLPWEQDTRRGFLKKGLVGGVILALGGAGWLALRRTRPVPVGGALQVLSPEEATVILAIAERLVPPRSGFPRPIEVNVPGRVDELVALSHPARQRDLKRLLRLFENALPGLLFERQLRPFTESTAAEQDARLAGWAHSRLSLRRTGYRAVKQLVYTAYYTAPSTHAALGYRGPPPLPRRVVQEPAAPASEPPEAPAPTRRPPRKLAPRPIELTPAPREGLTLPESEP